MICELTPIRCGLQGAGASQTMALENDPFRTLTARQRECLDAVALPMTAKEAALLLGCSPKTVESHLTQIVLKLGVNDRREAIRLWHRYHSASEKTLTDFSRLASRPPTASIDCVEQRQAQAGTLREPSHWEVGLTVPRRPSLFVWMRGLSPSAMTVIDRLKFMAVATLWIGLGLAVMVVLADAFARFGSTLYKMR